MKIFKRLASVLMVLSLPLVIVGEASAVNIFHQTCDSSTQNTSVCQDVNKQNGSSANPALRIIKDVINIISIIVGITAVIGVLVSALRMIVSAGDSAAVAGARSTLLYSLIGIAVVVLAQSIVAFVLNKL